MVRCSSPNSLCLSGWFLLLSYFRIERSQKKRFKSQESMSEGSLEDIFGMRSKAAARALILSLMPLDYHVRSIDPVFPMFPQAKLPSIMNSLYGQVISLGRRMLKDIYSNES